MADIDVEQEKGGQNTWIWIAVAVVSVIALMLWLATREPQTGPVVMEDGDAAGEEAGVPADTAELAAIAGTPAEYEGRTLLVRQADIAATLGPRAFWADVPGQNPFLVVVAPDAGDTTRIAAGETVDVRGSVAQVTPELVEQWIAEGAVNEGARAEAEFATHYLFAERLR